VPAPRVAAVPGGNGMNAAGNGGGEGAAPLALRTPPRSPNRGGSPSGGDGRSRSPASYSSRLSPRHRSLPRRMARAAGKKMRSLSPCHRPRSEQEAPASAPRPGAARELLSRSSTPEEDLAERLELAATAAEMRRRVRPRTLLHKGLIRANVFLAFEAVDWLVAERHAADRAGAVALGERMRVAGLIAHSRRPDKRFADADLAFAFTRSPRSPAGASAGGSTASSHPSSASASASGTPEGRRKSAEPAVVAAEPPLASGPDPARLRRLTLSVRHLHRRSLAAERSCAWWRVTAAVFFAVTVVQAGGWQYGPAAFSVVGIAAYSMAHTEAVDGSEAEFSGPGDGGGVVLESIDDYADMFREEDAPAAPPGSLERRPSSKQEYEAYVLNRVARLRGGLQEEFPDLDTENAYKDEYLATVLAQPDRRNQTQPRSVSYAMDKLKKAIRWRRGVTLPGPADVQKQMKTGSLYWYGYDNYGRPILWAHPSRKNYNEYDAQAEVKRAVCSVPEPQP